MSLKSTIAPKLHFLGLATGLSAAKARKQHVGRILAFHGVGDEYYPTKAFESELRWLKANFDIVSLDTLLQRLPTGLTNELVLTFDDGLRNNFTNAYPLLKQFNTPATFFVVPGLVDTGKWLWTHEVRARRFLMSSDALFELSPEHPHEADLFFPERLKTLNLGDRHAEEEKLRRVTMNFRPSPEQQIAYDLMSWDELRQLDPSLITIGSHSLTHPILPTLDGRQLLTEIVESRRVLEEKLQRTVEFFCYPNGSCNEEVVRTTAMHYRAALGTKTDFVRPGAKLHQLPRIGITPDKALLAWRMHRPGA